MNKYVEVARALAVPTREQTRGFAEEVARAHSWYKHLAVHPAVPFTFYLDPDGRDPIYGRDSPARQRTVYSTPSSSIIGLDPRPRDPEGDRRRFGYWACAEPTFSEAGLPSRPLTVVAGKRVLDVPESLKQAGTALVSSLMRPFGQSIAAVREGGQPPLQDWLNHSRILQVVLPDRNVSLWQLPDDRKACLPGDLAGAIRSLKALVEGDTYKRERTEAAWEGSSSSKKEKELTEAVLDAFERERERQIAAMEEAMNRFVAVLRDDGGRIA